MFCPNCGAGEQSSDAYCKRCGQWLSDQRSGKSRTSKTPDERMKTMLVFNGLSAVFGLFSAIALYATYLGQPEAKWSVYVAAAFCLVIAVHQTINFFFALELRQRLKRGRRDAGRAMELDAERSAASLGSGQTTEFVEARSVTEHTTELLEPLPRVREPGDSQSTTSP